MHCPYTAADGPSPNPKVISPWHGPVTVRSQLLRVIYRVARDGELVETPVRLGRITKAYPVMMRPVQYQVSEHLTLYFWELYRHLILKALCSRCIRSVYCLTYRVTVQYQVSFFSSRINHPV